MAISSERAEYSQAIESVVSRIIDDLHQAGGLDVPVRGETWMVRDAASHIAITQEIFSSLAAAGFHPYAGHDPSTYGAVNARLLASAGDRDTSQLIAAIRGGTDAFLAAAASGAPDAEYESPLGPMPLLPLMSYCLCHLLQHGHSISAALGRATPIEPGHVRLAMPFLEQATPLAYAMKTRPGISARVEIRVRGQLRFEIRFTPVAASVRPVSGDHVDCHLVTGAVPFLLILLGQTDPLRVVLRGQALAWGRRPWLALQLKHYLPGL